MEVLGQFNPVEEHSCESFSSTKHVAYQPWWTHSSDQWQKKFFTMECFQVHSCLGNTRLWSTFRIDTDRRSRQSDGMMWLVEGKHPHYIHPHLSVQHMRWEKRWMEEEHLRGGYLQMGEIRVLFNDWQKLYPLHRKPNSWKQVSRWVIKSGRVSWIWGT